MKEVVEEQVALGLDVITDGEVTRENYIFHFWYGHKPLIVATYTLLQKKRNFSEPIFPGDPGSLTLAPGHVHFVKWF